MSTQAETCNPSAGESRTERPSSAKPRAPISLLDLTLKQALRDALEHCDSKKYKTANLHPFATRARFSGTEPLSNRELLLILHPNTTTQTGAIDKRSAKHLRSDGKERSQKLGALLTYSLDLLRSKAVKNSDVVRGWAFALIHAAALGVLHKATSQQLAAVRAAESSESELVLELIAKARGSLISMVAHYSQSAGDRVQAGHKSASTDVFLHLAAVRLLEAMAQPAPAWTTFGYLSDVFYPKLNGCEVPAA